MMGLAWSVEVWELEDIDRDMGFQNRGTSKRPNPSFPLWDDFGVPILGNPHTIKHSNLSPGAIPPVAAIKELGFPAMAMEAFKCDH